MSKHEAAIHTLTERRDKHLAQAKIDRKAAEDGAPQVLVEIAALHLDRAQAIQKSIEVLEADDGE